MKEKDFMERVERWFRVTAPLITFILILVLYNMISAKTTFSVIIKTLSPFLFSFLIAWLLNPLVVSLTKRFKIKRWLASLIVLLVVFAILILIVMWIVPQLFDQFASLVNYLPNTVPKISGNLEDVSSSFNIDYESQYIDTIKSEFTNLFSSLFTSGVKIVTSSLNVVSSFVSSLFIMFMVLMASIYILIDFDKFIIGVNKLVPERMQEDFTFLRKQTNRVVVGYLRGLILETIIVAIIAYIAFAIFSIEGALVFAVIIGLTNIIPYFGPYIGAIPCFLLRVYIYLRLFMFIYYFLVCIVCGCSTFVFLFLFLICSCFV